MKRTSLALLLAAMLIQLPGWAASAIVRDNSLGAGPSTALLPAGTVSAAGISYNRVAIPESYGSRHGSNVFHSFASFDIGRGDAAVFGLSAPASNIISRVTGGQPSSIAGLISVDPGATGSRPKVFLINPSGVTFSAGAALDVPAAFHVSSANVVTFADGRFDADPARPSTLSSADPAAFGFLGARSGMVALAPGAALQAQAVTVAAAAIAIDGAAIGTGSGELRLAAVGNGAREVAAAGALPAGMGGTLSFSGQASASSFAAASERAGDIHIGAADILFGGGPDSRLGIGSSNAPGSSGATGAVHIGAANLRMEGSGGFAGIYTLAAAASSGAAGPVTVEASGSVLMTGGAFISSFSSGAGQGGAVQVLARDIGMRGQFTSIGSQSALGSGGNSGAVRVQALASLTVADQASVSSTSNGAGSSGGVTVRAGEILIDGAGTEAHVSASALSSSTGNAGTVDVAAERSLTLIDGGYLASSSAGAGNAGGITVRAASLRIEDRLGLSYGTGIFSDTFSATGNAGAIDLAVDGHFSMLGGVTVSSEVGGAGGGGGVAIRSGSMAIEGMENLFASVNSNALEGSSGHAGGITLEARGALSMRNNAYLLGTTSGSGNAGAIHVSAGSMELGGPGAPVGIVGSALPGGSGNGGAITLASGGHIALKDGALVRSDTFGAGAAGSITVAAASLGIEAGERVTGITSDARSGSTGAAGNIAINTSGLLSLVHEGTITSDTRGAGDAGAIAVDAGSILIDGRNTGFVTGITSGAQAGSGDAGAVRIAARAELALVAGGEINTVTRSAGAGGSVSVDAGTIRLDAGQIVANAYAGSSGQSGSVSVRARDAIVMSNYGFLGIENAASIADSTGLVPALLYVSAPLIEMDGSAMSASASGNIAAGGITVLASERLAMRDSAISTSATDGNGGPIAIDAGRLLSMRGSAIRTSVSGVTGNGGDIAVDAGVLLMDSAAIRANTLAQGQRGGDVDIAAGALIASGSTLIAGGSTAYLFDPAVFGFNLIQAAAPDGVSGVVALSSPLLDVAGTLGALSAAYIDTGGLGRSPCLSSGGSTLSQTGRGAMPPSARGPLAAAAPAPGLALKGPRHAGAFQPGCGKG